MKKLALGVVITTIEMWANLVGTWLVFLLMVLVCSDVAFRALSGSSITGAIELGELLMVGITILTVAYTQNERGHVRMDLVVDRWKGKPRQWVEACIVFMCLGFSIVALIMTSKLAGDSIAKWEIVEGVSQLPKWPWKTLIPVGFLLLCVRLITQLIEHVRMALAQSSNKG